MCTVSVTTQWSVCLTRSDLHHVCAWGVFTVHMATRQCSEVDADDPEQVNALCVSLIKESAVIRATAGRAWQNWSFRERSLSRLSVDGHTHTKGRFIFNICFYPFSSTALQRHSSPLSKADTFPVSRLPCQRQHRLNEVWPERTQQSSVSLCTVHYKPHPLKMSQFALWEKMFQTTEPGNRT